MLNLILKKPTAVPPYEYPEEKSFTCEALTIKLDPFEQDYIRVECDPELRETRILIPAEGGEECVYSYIAEEL